MLPVSSSSRAIVRWIRPRNAGLDADVADPSPGRRRPSPSVDPAEVAELAHLAQVVVAPRQVEEQVADGVEAELDARPAAGRRPAASPEPRERGRQELDRIGRSVRRLRDGALALATPTRRRSGTGRTAGRRGGPRPRRRARRPDPAGHRLRLGQVGAVAVEQRDQLEAGRERRDRRRGPPSRGRRRPRRRPSSGSERDRLAALDLASADRRVTDRLGHDWSVWIARPASVIGPALAAASRRRVEREQRGEALGRVAGRDDGTGRSVIARRPGARRGPTFGLFGRTMISRASTRVDRLEQLAGARVGRLAALDDRGDPEVAEDRGQAVAGDDRDDAERRGRRAVAASRRRAVATARAATVAAAPARSPVNAAARVSRTSRAWLSRFSTLIRLSAPSASPYADDQVRALVVDVDLERPRVAGDEDRLADRLEVVADRIDVERLPEPFGWSEEHRLVAEALVGVGDQRRRLGAGDGVRASRAAPAGDRADEVEQRALEQPVEPLPARVDDAGLAQDRQQASASARPTSRRPRRSRPGRSRCRCRARRPAPRPRPTRG